MKKLSQESISLQSHYHAVVVGSGYGAGIAASRLSRMGRNVCVLERGPERVPGEFPETLSEATDEFQVDLPFKQLGSKTALFDMHVNSDISVLVGCGLGGTSLINGNVMLIPDRRVFDKPDWPEQIRADFDGILKEGYERASRMIQPVSYPNEVKLKKLEAFETAANVINGKFSLPPITVTFDANEKGNYAGVVQEDCTLCGDCCSGCNIGAKNTTALNYIPDAVNHGAEVYTLMSVHHVEKEGDVWRVYYQQLNREDGEPVTDDYQSITAETVVLGAGTLGSTEILLRSREAGLSLSDRLGKNFSGNGDVIAFGYNNDVPINGIGTGNPMPDELEPVGPVIAGLIDLRDTKDVSEGMVIQEGAIPSALAAIMPALTSSASPLFGEDTDSGWKDFVEEKMRSWKSIFKGAYQGAVHHTQTLLVMAHDGGGGDMTLSKDKVRIDWQDAGDRPVFKRIGDVLHKITAATGGTFINNPVWSKALGRSLISVHPLGGCCLGESSDSGVVNHKCQVFDGEGNNSVYEGLYVTDGAIMPSSLGVNPSMTISAIAERAMIYYALDHDLKFDDKPMQDAPLRYAKSE